MTTRSMAASKVASWPLGCTAGESVDAPRPLAFATAKADRTSRQATLGEKRQLDCNRSRAVRFLDQLAATASPCANSAMPYVSWNRPP